MEKIDIKELTKAELVSWLEDHGLKKYRADQIHKWVYTHQSDDFEEMTDLGKKHRKLLSDHFTVGRLEQVAVETSTDGTRKFLFRLSDDQHIESVLIPGEERMTLCISSQSGCAQACEFCLTAKGGFKRNLTAGEIIGQVRDLKKLLEDTNTPLTNIVFMGMGEPLANYKNVVNALAVINDGDFGLKISARRVTVSTAGLVPKMEALGRDTRANLAVSLNATDNETRTRLMPVNRKYPMEMLLEACRTYPLAPRDKITFEYILISGINDSDEDARRLVKLLAPIASKVNLIPFNEHAESEFKCPSNNRVHRFLQILHDNGYTAIIRKSMGQDISAACGQLSANKGKL